MCNMKLCLFDGRRVGVVRADTSLVDVSAVVPGWSADPLSCFFNRLCRDFDELRPVLEQAAADGPAMSLTDVRLSAPVLNPSKLIAAAMNYGAHRTEMEQRSDRSNIEWRMEFDVFLKAPSSIIGSADRVELPDVGDAEIHHECELALVIGTAGRDIAPDEALRHVVGYTTLIDVTVRGPGDRSRRKSYDTFSPTGPFLVTRDEVPDPQDVDIELVIGGETRQLVNTRDMLVPVTELISYASQIMTLLPGDVICTGAPPGVGPIVAGDVMETRLSGLGSMSIPVVTRQPAVAGAAS
jgi:2-keto-4-pentenoate hydratase/2-oxohepta-3-ene-1,7-dioic acid hydratase in catechol pathway